MKKKISFLLIALCILAAVSCKKAKDDLSSSTDNSSQYSSQADDQQQVSTEMDNVANDANTSLDSYSNLNGGRIEGTLCDASISVDTSHSVKTVTITYDGTSCDSRRHREGTVTLSMPAGQHWSDQGAVLTININNLKITRLRDSKSIVVNGTITVTNVTGGLVKNLATLGTITHTIVSNNMSITFDNGSQRDWSISKQRVFTYSNGIVITTTGTHSDGTDNTIAEWGTNRFGTAFTSSTTEPMVVSQDCDFRITSGQITHDRSTKSFVVTFGLDSNGDPTTCPGTGTYYFKVQWTNAKGTPLQVILPY